MEIKGLPASAPLPSIIKTDNAGYPGGGWLHAYGSKVSNPSIMSVFFLAMSLIIMGVGFLKANLATMVGQLYTKDDPRRDAGFSLYYFRDQPRRVLGAGALCAGRRRYGWSGGFGLAGIGMLFGWLVFVRRRFLFFTPGPAQIPAELGIPPNPELLRRPLLGPLNREWLIYILAHPVGVAGVLLSGPARADREHRADHRVAS